MTDLAHIAQARARHQSLYGPQFGKNQCMWRCRELVDAPAIGDYDGDGSPDAEDGWKFAKHKHPTTLVNDVPGGCYAWWGGGSNDNGHVAFTDPDQRGMCWSTDIKRTGYFDLVPLGLITTRWGLPLLGWSEDIDGVRVYRAALTQEDDMNKAELLEVLNSKEGRNAIGAAVRATMLPTAPQPDGTQANERLGSFIQRVGATTYALLDEVAKAQGLTPDQLAAIRQTIADAVVDVDVTVHDQTGD